MDKNHRFVILINTINKNPGKELGVLEWTEMCELDPRSPDAVTIGSYLNLLLLMGFVSKRFNPENRKANLFLGIKEIPLATYIQRELE